VARTERERGRGTRAVILAGFALAVVGLLITTPFLGAHGAREARVWLAAVRGPWALPAVIGVFALLAFVGAPQVALIAAAVVVFGPVRGALYSWVGTMASALVGFAIGRLVGPRALASVASGRLDRFIAALGENGFFASLSVRLVPLAPFVIVNLAAGVTAMRLLDFAGGTALGIIPKIVLTAFAGESVLRALRRGDAGAIALAVGAVILLLAAGFLAQRWIRLRRARVTS
jgi:uncharacterized membrane protein YdjX (TVP38/TMEM64 family)